MDKKELIDKMEKRRIILDGLLRWLPVMFAFIIAGAIRATVVWMVLIIVACLILIWVALKLYSLWLFRKFDDQIRIINTGKNKNQQPKKQRDVDPFGRRLK